MATLAETMWAQEARAFGTYLCAAGRATSTIRLRLYYVARLRRFGRVMTGEDLPPWQVSMDTLIEFLAQPWRPETRKNARSSVVAFYRWAVETGRIGEGDCPARRLPAVSVGRALPRPAPTKVLAQALLAASDRDRLFLLLAAYGGLRRGEIAAVHPARDIDRDRKRLCVHGKGGKDRWVPLHPALLIAIDHELERRRTGRHGTGWRYTSQLRPDGPLFPGAVDGHVGADVPGKALAKILDGDWTAHTLRHRFASQAYAEDRDLRAVQELLGHSKPETTARYVAVPDGALRAAVLAVSIDPSAA